MPSLFRDGARRRQRYACRLSSITVAIYFAATELTCNSNFHTHCCADIHTHIDTTNYLHADARANLSANPDTNANMDTNFFADDIGNRPDCACANSHVSLYQRATH